MKSDKPNKSAAHTNMTEAEEQTRKHVSEFLKNEKNHAVPTRRVAPHKSPHTPKKATTLLRSAVKQPDFKNPRGLVHAAQAALDQRGSQAVNLQRLVASPKPEQIKSAQKTTKNSMVSHFNFAEPQNTYPAIQTVDVRRSEPVTPRQENLPSPSINPFDTAVARSHSHLEKPFKSKPRFSHFLPFLILGIMVLSIGGFVAYRSIPRVNFKLVSSNSAMPTPSYTVPSFALDDTEQGPQSLTLRYSVSDRNYIVKEQPTSWNDTTLLNEFVLKENKSYQTVEQNGRLFYIFSDNSVTWVKTGVWYQLSNNANLTQPQVLAVASST